MIKCVVFRCVWHDSIYAVWDSSWHSWCLDDRVGAIKMCHKLICVTDSYESRTHTWYLQGCKMSQDSLENSWFDMYLWHGSQTHMCHEPIRRELICDMINMGSKCCKTRWSTHDMTCVWDICHEPIYVTNSYVSRTHMWFDPQGLKMLQDSFEHSWRDICVWHVSRTHMCDLIYRGSRCCRTRWSTHVICCKKIFVIICVTNLYVSRTHMIYRGSRCCRTRWSTHVICCKKIL